MAKRQRIQLIPIPGSHAIVDTGVPGWSTLEQHADRQRADAALKRHRAAHSTRGSAKRPTAPPKTATTPTTPTARTPDPLLVPLDNNVRTVRAGLSKLTRAELRRLHALELAGDGRATITDSIDARIRSLTR